MKFWPELCLSTYLGNRQVPANNRMQPNAAILVAVGVGNNWGCIAQQSLLELRWVAQTMYFHPLEAGFRQSFYAASADAER